MALLSSLLRRVAPRSLRTRLLAAFLAPLAVVALTWLAGVMAMRTSLAHERELARGNLALGSIHGLTRSVLDAETGVRGYVITGELRFLQPREHALGAFPSHLQRLLTLEQGRPPQLRRLSKIATLFGQWNTEAAAPAIALREANPDRPFSEEDTRLAERGKVLMDALRDLTAAAEADELDALRGREEATLLASRSGQLTLGVGSALATVLALLLAIGFATRVGGATRAVAAAAGALARGDLSHRAEVSSDDELGEAARAFNRMADQLEARTLQHELFTQMGKLLHACASFDEARRVVRQMVPALFPEESGVLFLNLGSDGFDPVATWGTMESADLHLGVDECWALRGVGVHWAQDPQHDVRCRHLENRPERESLCVPVLAQGERVGALCLEARAPLHTEEPHFTLGRRHMAELVAEYVALAAVNLGLREALKSQAMRDPLTSLYNRRYLEESFTRELNWARRRHRPVSVIFCDVDHFKRFNDAHGHEAGDVLLREMATVIRSVFRGEDIVCRYGGEEFVVLVRDCSLEDTVKRAEQLRRAVKSLRIAHQGRGLGEVTMSLGVSTFPEHGETPADLLREADQALFRAKGLGRNQVVVARGVEGPSLEVVAGESWPVPLKSSSGGKGISS